MNNTVKLFMDAFLALFAFFAVAPILLNAVAQFGVHKRFANAMIEEGVITAEAVKEMLPKKQIAGVIVSAVVLGVLGVTCYKTAPFGYLCAGVPFVVGLWKYRNVVQFNSLTVQRFQATFKDKYDAAKLNKYVDKMF